MFMIFPLLVVGNQFEGLSPGFVNQWLLQENQATIQSSIQHFATELQMKLGLPETKENTIKTSLESYVQDEAKEVFQDLQDSLNMPDSDPDMTLRFFGSLLPIFNVSKECSEASWTILSQSFHPHGADPTFFSCNYQ